MKSKSLHHQVTKGTEKAKKNQGFVPSPLGRVRVGSLCKPHPLTPSPTPKESLRDKERGNYIFEDLALPLLSVEGVGG